MKTIGPVVAVAATLLLCHGAEAQGPMVTFQWQKEKKVIVWPDELAAGKPLFPTPPWTSR